MIPDINKTQFHVLDQNVQKRQNRGTEIRRNEQFEKTLPRVQGSNNRNAFVSFNNAAK